VGSFLNVVIYRLEDIRAVFSGRSRCLSCGTVLKWYDLIPVLSFLIQKGKCRYCRQRISWQYPLVELFTGILFVLLLNYKLGIMNHEIFNFEFILYSLFLILNSCFLIIIFVYDLKHYIIPDKIIYPAILIALLFNLLNYELRITNYELLNIFLAAFSTAAFFLFLVLVSQGKWMGLGDVKLVFLIGLILGWPDVLIALFLAFLSGAIVGIGLIIFGKKKLKSQIPFGPFLTGATILVILFGQYLTGWFQNVFLF